MTEAIALCEYPLAIAMVLMVSDSDIVIGFVYLVEEVVGVGDQSARRCVRDCHGRRRSLQPACGGV